MRLSMLMRIFIVLLTFKIRCLACKDMCQPPTPGGVGEPEGNRMLQVARKVQRTAGLTDGQDAPGSEEILRNDATMHGAASVETGANSSDVDNASAAYLAAMAAYKAQLKAAEAAHIAMEFEMIDFPEDCRRYVQLTHQWEGSPPLGDNQSLKLGDVAIGLISGRSEFYHVAHQNILQYTPRGLLIRAKGKCPCSFRAALGVLREAHPDAEWYYVGDEDVMINLANVVQLLGQYDPAVPTLVASNGGHDICESCGACPSVSDQLGNPSAKAFYGGTGQIFSRRLVELLAPSLSGSCWEASTPTLSGFGDLENTCSISHYWQPSWRFVRLERSVRSWFNFTDTKPSFFVAHHLCPTLVERLADVNAAQLRHWKEPVFANNSDIAGCDGVDDASEV